MIRFAVSILVWLLPTAALGASEAPPLTPRAERGLAVFQEKCVACHTVGQGDRVGPDLAGVVARRDRTWLTRWISAPDRMLAMGDPTATAQFQKYKGVPMPNQGLTDDDVTAVIAYLEAPSGGVAAAAGQISLPPGDPAIGKELFIGTRRFRNGGAPCMGCHSIGGIGALGGGALGPDLTLAASKFGDAGLASVLASPPFPTMSPIFARRPLAPEEQAHLRAFVMQAAITERSPQAVGRLTGFAVVGAVVLLGLMHVSWRRRLTTVRRPMVEAQRSARTPRPLAGR